MNLRVTRTNATDLSLTGFLDIDGVYFCRTLENRALAIAVGTYVAKARYSKHNKCNVIGIFTGEHSILGRTDIEIHVANEPHELLGCIAVGGYLRTPDYIGASRIAFDRLMAAFTEPAAIEVVDAFMLESND